MKTTVLAVALALLATPVLAQMGDKGPPEGGKKGGEHHKRPPVDEKAYKAALDRIPEPKEKYDPWGQMRPNPPVKKTN